MPGFLTGALKNWQSPIADNPALLDFPPGFVNQTTQVPAGDTSPEAQFYPQLGKVAQYLAANICKTATDTIDRNNANHVPTTINNATVQAIARAISLYVFNVPYSTVKNTGWKNFLAQILRTPLVTWNAKASYYTTPGPGGSAIPAPMQQRGLLATSDKWAIHPAYFPFFFWNGSISFYRFLRYDPVVGFCFTNEFANNAVLQSIFACCWAPWQDVPIESWIGSKFGGPAALSKDGLYALDTGSQWLYDPANMPAQFTAKLQAFGNSVYSAEAHAALMQDIAIAGAVLAIVSAGASIAATGLTLVNGFSLFTAFETSPFGVPSEALKNIAVYGKLLNLPALVGSMGLNMSSAPEISGAGGSSVSVDSFADLGDDSGAADVSASDLYGIDTSLVPSDPSVSVPTIDQVTGTDLTDLTGMNDPSVTTTAGVSSGDVTTNADGSLNINLDSAAPVPEVAPSAIEPSASDMAISGTDTSTMDSAMDSSVSAGATSTGGFNAGNFVTALAKAYTAVVAAQKAGQTKVANHPTPGTVKRLPDGSTAVVNADGSTTVTSPTGAKETILPSGKVIAGGDPGAMNSVLLYGAVAVAAFFLLRKI